MSDFLAGFILGAIVWGSIGFALGMWHITKSIEGMDE